MNAEEHVLVTPTSLFHQIGHFQGFSRDTQKYLSALLDPAQTSYQPRSLMENDPSFKQLIPYAIIQHKTRDGETRLFRYTRGKGQGEARLHAKQSIGVGGHISSLDQHSDSVYLQGFRRELNEEVHIESTYRENIVGLINDDESEVGKVHLGVVHLLTMDYPSVRSREDDVAFANFQTISEIQREFDRLETWSQIALLALFS